MNIPLLRKVQEYILKHPNRFLMDAFLVRMEDSGETFLADDDKTEVKFDQCGTAACIAGWTCLINDQNNKIKYDIESKARDLLDIDAEQAGLLFYSPNWPQPYALHYSNATTQSSRARIAARRIDHFIATQGKE